MSDYLHSACLQCPLPIWSFNLQTFWLLFQGINLGKVIMFCFDRIKDLFGYLFKSLSLCTMQCLLYSLVVSWNTFRLTKIIYKAMLLVNFMHTLLKGKKWKFCTFIHPHAVPNMYDVLLYNTHACIDVSFFSFSFFLFFHAMKVNGVQYFQWGPPLTFIIRNHSFFLFSVHAISMKGSMLFWTSTNKEKENASALFSWFWTHWL